jgi:hypothetical protein
LRVRVNRVPCLVHVVKVVRRAVLQRCRRLAALPQRRRGGVAPLGHHAAQGPAQLRPEVSPQHDVLQEWVIWAAAACGGGLDGCKVGAAAGPCYCR